MTTGHDLARSLRAAYPARHRRSGAAFDEEVSLLYVPPLRHGRPRRGRPPGCQALYETLRQGVVRNVVFHDLEGQGHEWQTWWYALHDFAPRLFQQSK